MSYQHLDIEPKWQAAWEKDRVFATPELREGDDKAYILDFFPYPSGSGLHVGHMLGYTGTDILSRVARMRGKKVLHPMGWDAFGLPAENFAIKSGVHPAISTAQNVQEFKRQFRQAGISYDWEKEINSSDPEYYKWTQWIFSLLYQRGLAYRKDGMVNWCPSCQTVLANEQVVNGQCERCGSTVLQKQLKQWYFKITEYADRLLEGLDRIDWPEKVKTMQRNWIGKSEGAELHFAVKGSDQKIEVFTTRPDTVYGATYMVLAPEHALLSDIVPATHKEAVKRYQEEAALKSELERSFLEKEKTGVFTGAYAVNPATGQEIPIWIADYVIASYGTGAIMAVPAHDERDFAFAQQFKLQIVQVIEGEAELPFTGKGNLINSAEFSGQDAQAAVPAILAKIGGQPSTTYRLRDWLVSRQRFWGSPIPIAYDAEGREHLLPDDQLPVKLPDQAEFLPTGQSPLVQATEWKKYVDPASGQEWQREVDTLDTFVCSSWYYLRYPTPRLDSAAFDKAEVEKWLPVDRYVGGAEHAVLHLLYARFLTKALFDAGLVPFDEPFQSLRTLGVILGPDNNKMSKSKGNVISPDDVIKQYGSDTLRTYEMFMAPFDIEKPWSTTSIVGVRRFLEKVWRLQERVTEADPTEAELTGINRAVHKVSSDIDSMRFNTAVSTMMEAVNSLFEQETIAKATYTTLLLILNPFAPHITEELWQMLGETGYISVAPWPSADEAYLKESETEYPVQVNGKVRFKVTLSADTSSEEVLAAVKAHPRYTELVGSAIIKKELVIPGRLVSLVLG